MFGLTTSDIDRMSECFAAYPVIEQAVVYGSRAKGNYRPGSDIDLTLVEQGMSYTELLKLENDVDDLLLPYKIDLSLKRQITNPELLVHIERVGQVFYARAAQNVLNDPSENYAPQKVKGGDTKINKS